jgi:preprotein translocase subunit SecE
MTGMSPAKFIREVRQEASRVAWPTRKETTTSTVMVLVLVLIASIFFLIVDGVISFSVEKILGLGS